MSGDYQTIPGVGTGRASLQIALRSRLYQGPDHLLIMQTSGYTEEYKRIFYRDIRYVVARKTNGQQLQGVWAGLLFVAVFLLNLTPAPWWLVDLLSLPFLIWFVRNWLAGPICQCSIATDVQVLPLPAPRRFGKVPALIEFLQTRTGAGLASAGPTVT